MIIKVKNPNVILKTKDKYLIEDIQILVDESVVNGEVSTLKTLLDATKSTQHLFYYYAGESVDHLISYNDTENVEKFDSMFVYAKVTSLPALNTSNLISMCQTFNGCTLLKIIPSLDVRNVTNFSMAFSSCRSIESILMYGMKETFKIKECALLEAKALVTILSNCQVVTTSPTLTMGSDLLAKLDGVYVKLTNNELYEGITCNPCEICESTDEGAMLVTDYATLKGWTLA